MGKDIRSTSTLVSKTSGNKAAIAISTGDPGGIGPEIILDSLNKLMHPRESRRKEILPWDFIPVIIGDYRFFEGHPKEFGEHFKIIKGENLEEKRGALEILLRSGTGIFFDMGHSFSQKIIGKENEENARASYEYFRLAFELSKRGLVRGIVTGPVNKGSINNAGIKFTGHTEEFREFARGESTDYDNPFMLMYHKDIRVLLLTIHIPLNEVYDSLDLARSKKAISSAIQFLEINKRGKVKIALLGVDPHIGDQGAIGSKDKEFSVPLVSLLQSENIDIEGPKSADSFFNSRNLKKYDLVVSPYHDQGLIPFKMVCFGRGVNITLNLPVKRTSPDHGTAFEIAGKNKADSRSMQEAILLCNKWIYSDLGKK